MSIFTKNKYDFILYMPERELNFKKSFATGRFMHRPVNIREIKNIKRPFKSKQILIRISKFLIFRKLEVKRKKRLYKY